MRPVLLLLAAAIALAAPAVAASAAGGPVPPQQGGSGVALVDGAMRYTALASAGGTIVERIRVHGGTLEAVRYLPESVGIPLAAYDETATGLSADGRTLVLAPTLGNRPPRRTRLVVLDTERLHVRSRIVVPGTAMVDAVSPDGRWLYLTRYDSDLVGYRVQAYDLTAGRLLRSPIVDPREPDEAMQGLPMTRAMSPDGRWAYTLYQRPQGEPFVHALDTSRRTARCIDIPALEGVDLFGTRIEVREGGATLTLVTDAGPQAVIDTRSFAVRRPEAAAAAAVSRPAATRSSGDGGVPVALLVAVAAAALAAAALVVGRRRRALGS